MSFNGGVRQLLACFCGRGLRLLLPNYRGSTNYGEKHKMEIAGDYFRQGYDDIMTGVDHLISAGLG